MKIAITGATGFIGKKLLSRHLELGDNIRILTRRKDINLSFQGNVSVFHGDISDNTNDLHRFVNGVDILYHCAAEIRNSSKMFKVNVEGTDNLIQAACKKIGHWVQLSSVGVYGPHYSGIIDESTPVNPINIYEKTKLMSDLHVIRAAENRCFTYCILRPSNVFGPEMRNQSLFQLIKTVDKGLFFFIGQKGAIANYITVENVVEALALCGTKKRARNRIYNLSDWGKMENFILIIASKLGKSTPKIRMPFFFMKCLGKIGGILPKSLLTTSRVDALTNRAIYEIKKIKNDLGYVHILSMEEGISRLVSNYNSLKKGKIDKI